MRISITGCAFFALMGVSIGQTPISHVYVEPSQTLVYDTIRVNAGQALQYNFGLARGTRLSAQFQVSGGMNNQIQVMLLDETNYQLYSARQRYSVFRGTSGTVRGIGSYSFVIPQTGVYHVLLDNGRAWLMPRNVTLHLYSVSPEPTPESQKIQQAFENEYRVLKKVFVFKDFAISIRHCGVVNAFSNPNITLCIELVDELARRNLGGAMAFVFFHELGHSLLREWGYPLWDNEDAADEFATVFLMMGKQQQFALQAAQYWSSTTSADAVAKIWMDDRHTLSPQRARNIAHWLNNGNELLPRWQKLLIPNIQTEELQKLIKNPEGFNSEAVRSELSHRAVAANDSMNHNASAAKAILPTAIGECTTTTVSKIGTRLTDGISGRDMPGSGSLVLYANGGSQVSYDTVPAIDHSRVGDKILLCLASIPSSCPPGDDRGKSFTAKNLRTGETWRLPNSQHSCGGA